MWCEKADRQLKEMEVASTRATLSKELKSNRRPPWQTLPRAFQAVLEEPLLRARQFRHRAAQQAQQGRGFRDPPELYGGAPGLGAAPGGLGSLRELVISEGKWRSYLHFAFNDPEARVRAAALDVLPALLTSGHVAMATGKALGQDLRERVLARCQDVDALAGAAALRAACALAQVEALEEAWRRVSGPFWRFSSVSRPNAWCFHAFLRRTTTSSSTWSGIRNL